MELHFTGTIIQNGDMDAAYIVVPYDIKDMFGKGRLPVEATFDGVPYRGQVVRMGTPEYIIGIRKDIRKKIGKTFGDTVEVTIKEQIKEESFWTCPTCGRTFKRKNQSHSCGKKPQTIAEYIEGQDLEKQGDLRTIYGMLKDELPSAKEKISWAMPTFYGKKNIIHFAAFKKHIGIYPGPKVIENLKDLLTCYKTSKGTIQIPYGGIDEELIRKVAREALKFEEE